MRRRRYPELWTGCVLATCASQDSSRSKLVTDFSGSGNHGAMNVPNATIASRYAPSQHGIVHRFYGAENYNCGRCRQLEGIANCTASFWARRAAVGSILIWDKRASGSNLFQWSASGAVCRFVPKTNAIYGEYSLDDTEWHHYCYLFDGTQATNSTRLRLVLDGTEVTLSYAGTIGTVIANPTNDLRVGLGGTGSYSTGDHADLRLYTRTLSLGEARLLSTSPTVAYDTVRDHRGRRSAAAAFKPAWASQRSQLIGGGNR